MPKREQGRSPSKPSVETEAAAAEPRIRRADKKPGVEGQRPQTPYEQHINHDDRPNIHASYHHAPHRDDMDSPNIPLSCRLIQGVLGGAGMLLSVALSVTVGESMYIGGFYAVSMLLAISPLVGKAVFIGKKIKTSGWLLESLPLFSD